MYKIFSLLLLLVGIGMAVMSYQQFRAWKTMEAQSERVEAVVFNLEVRHIRTNREAVRKYYHPIVVVPGEDDKSQLIVLEEGSQVRNLSKGDTVNIIFPEDEISRARLATWLDSWLLPAAFLLTAMLSFSLSGMVWKLKRIPDEENPPV